MKTHLLLPKIGPLIILFGLIQSVPENPAMAQSPQKLFCGYAHSLAITSDSILWVWGGNGFGQLGNGSSGGAIWYPVTVSGMTTIKDAAGGHDHSVALKGNGTVWAWGSNYQGQLGDGTTTLRTTPVQTSALSNVVNVGVGYNHSFAIKNDGTLWAWGDNDDGQLGNGSTTDQTTPVQITGLSSVTDVAAGQSHSVALKSDGTMWAWGHNGYGQLGDGTTTPRTSPVQVSGGINVVAIAAGFIHTLALKSDGTVWAWGSGSSGQLGNGSNPQSQLTPVQVSNLSDVVAIAADTYHCLALKSDGTLWAWGNDELGQLGNGDPLTNQSIPVQVGTLTGWSSVGAGYNSSLAGKSDGSVWGWGNNGSGQIGNGLNANSSVPLPSLFTFADKVKRPTFSPDGGTYIKTVKVKITCSTNGATIHYTTNGVDPTENDPVIASGLKVTIATGNTRLKARAFKTGLVASDVKAAVYQMGEKVASGYAHSLAITSDSILWVWGSNSNGQLGNGSTGAIWYPVTVSGMTTIKDAAGGQYHSVALKGNGTVWAWGSNSNGQLGDGTTTQHTTPVQVSTLGSVVNVGAGYSHSLAIKSDGTLWGWGYNNYGQLGNGNTTNQTTPVQITGLSSVTDVAAGLAHSVALKSDGTMWAWGSNSNGQLGDGTATTRTSPVPVNGGINVVAIAAGWIHTLALKSDGTVWAWGYGGGGQLGNGSTPQSQSTPVQVSNLSDVVAIAAGTNHCLALKSDGTLWAWGSDEQGQLGNGDPLTSQSIPVQVGTLSGWSSVGAGFSSLAGKSDGSVWGWGDNSIGQIGNGLNANSSVPLVSLFTFADKVKRPTFSPDGGAYINSVKVKITCSTNGATIHYTTNGVDPTENDPVITSGSKVTIADGNTRLKARAFKTGLVASDVKAAVYQVGEKVVCGYAHSLAITSDSILWVWGDNTYGQLGNGVTGGAIWYPVTVSGMTTIRDAAGGRYHSVTLKKDGTVWAWGLNGQGQLGDGTTTLRTTPVQVSTLSSVVNVGTGFHHSFAIKSDGTLWAWGDNDAGQLGNGSTTDQTTPVQITGLSSVTDVAAGLAHSVALKSDGTMWAWGSNSNGQLGDGTATTTTRTSPVPVNGGINVVAIAAGWIHTLALKSDGTVWAWGNGLTGLLGNGSTPQSQATPVQVSNLSDVVAIAAGDNHCLAVKNDGTLWAWGYNTNGQLGDGTTSQRNTPVQVVALAGVTSISGGTHSLALTPLEEVKLYWAWGYNNYGQLGDSSTVNTAFRVLVHFPIDEDGNAVADWQDYVQSNSISSDNDQDGLPAWQEMLIYGTDYINHDCNGDGLADGVNVFVGYAPLNSDTDGDGISNTQELVSGTSSIRNDTDGDGEFDATDPFPLDPARTSLPALDPSDHTPPLIIIE